MHTVILRPSEHSKGLVVYLGHRVLLQATPGGNQVTGLWSTGQGGAIPTAPTSLPHPTGTEACECGFLRSLDWPTQPHVFGRTHLHSLRLVRGGHAGPDRVLPEGRLRLGQEALQALAGTQGHTGAACMTRQDIFGTTESKSKVMDPLKEWHVYCSLRMHLDEAAVAL